MIEGIAKKMHVAALPGGLLQHLRHSPLEPQVIVADDELHPVQAALLEATKKVLPGCSAFPVGQLDAQQAPLAITVDADGDEHRPTPDNTAFANALVPSIQNHIRVRLGQPPLVELVEPRVQSLVQTADGARREAGPAQFFCDFRDLPS